ncbi:MAG: hypothetical protein D3910_05945 [Candidatus Electrothrix sp. ATG2]|nr:hypothetical protein [Candidatus Electrothrix sp. ATG2]
MEIFLGYSSQRQDIADHLSVIIEENGMIPLHWNDPGLFRPNSSIFHTLIEISKRKTLKGAIFIFSEDDNISSTGKGNLTLQPRDNVLIEFGLFVGSLGIHKSIICKYGSPKMAIDLAGIIYINLNEKAKSKLELSKWLHEIK